jgi:hypothetical protein
MIFTVAPTLKTDVIKTLSDYRRKDMFDGRSFNAKKIEIHRGSDLVTLEKMTKDGKDTWKKADGKDADTSKVEDLLGKLTALRAQSFDSVANAALKSPAMMVTLTYDKTKTETVTFAKAGTDVVAARGDEPGTAKLETMPFDDAVKAVDGVK